MLLDLTIQLTHLSVPELKRVAQPLEELEWHLDQLHSESVCLSLTVLQILHEV